jgi:ferredoxin
MRVSIDVDCCAGHGACVDTCPEVFVIGDDGYAEVILAEVPDALIDAARRAARECPTRAILTDG